MFQVVERPGYFGKKRPEKEKEYNAKYGKGQWQERWQFDEDFLSLEEALKLYDMSYYEWLHDNRYWLDFISNEYKECYDNDPSNIESGCNHDPNAVPRHIQDVSVRKAMKLLGVTFNSASPFLLQIRGPESNGYWLSPMIIPFVFPRFILKAPPSTPKFPVSCILTTADVAESRDWLAPPVGSPVKDWVRKGSVEEFYQRNKVIVIMA